MHRGIRTLADSPASALAWQAIAVLPPDTWTALVRRMSQALEEAMLRDLERVAVARAVRQALDHELREQTGPGGAGRETEDLGAFALRTLRLALSMTPDEEFQSGWLGYVWAPDTAQAGEADAARSA